MIKNEYDKMPRTVVPASQAADERPYGHDNSKSSGNDGPQARKAGDKAVLREES